MLGKPAAPALPPATNAQREAEQATAAARSAQCEAARRVADRMVQEQAIAYATAAERRRREEASHRLAVARLEDALIGVRAAGIVGRAKLRGTMALELGRMRRAPSVVR